MAVGLKIQNQDFVLLGSGQLEFITGKEKCSRDFYKMLCTEVESESNLTGLYRYNPTYGTELYKRELFNDLTDKEVLQVAQVLVKQAIQNYIRLQESRKNLSLGEIITGVEHRAYIVTDPTYGRKVVVNINLSLASGEQFNLGMFEEYV